MTDTYEQTQQESVQMQPEMPPEKMVTMPQSQIDKIVGSARTKGYERGVQQAAQYIPPVQEYAQNPAGYQQAPRALTEDAANDLVNRRLAEIDEQRKRQEQTQREEAENAQFMQHFNQVNSTLEQQALSKEVKERDPDLIKKIQSEGSFNDQYLYPVKAIASEFDNGAEVLGHLVDNPSLMSNIANSAKPEWKRKLLAKVSKQIKAEQTAQNTTSPNLPAGNVKSSPGLSVKSNGSGAPTSDEDVWASIRGKFHS